MLKLTGILFIWIDLISCGIDRQNANNLAIISSLIDITENEENGIKSILEFYGGYCKYSRGASISTNGGKQKYFGVDLSESSTLDETSLALKLVASNVARLFFHELKEERSNYDFVEVTLKRTGETVKTFEVHSESLLLVEEKQKALEVVEKLTKSQSYVELIELFPKNAEIRSLESDKLVKNLLAIDSIYGKVNQSILLLGFETFYHRSDDERIRLYCVQRRTKRNLNYKLDLAKSLSSKRMYNFDYSY